MPARRRRRRDNGTVEMQMGPMIDMVFLLLVFFMVTARPVKPEADISLGLPGALAQDAPVDLPDELLVTLTAAGEVRVNDQAHDDGSLRRLLQRFKQAADANRSDALVSLDPADKVPHQRLVDVLDACAAAGITGVTFVDSGSGGGGMIP